MKATTTDDQLKVLYRTLLVFATVGVVILAIGLVQFVYFEPIGQATGVKAHIVGVYAYDPATKSTVGPDRSEFPRNYCTPVIWETGGKKQIVVAATLRAMTACASSRP